MEEVASGGSASGSGVWTLRRLENECEGVVCGVSEAIEGSVVGKGTESSGDVVVVTGLGVVGRGTGSAAIGSGSGMTGDY